MCKNFLIPFVFLLSLSLIISSCNEKDEPHFFELDKTTLSFEIEGGSQNIAISSNGNWTVSNNADWLIVSPQSDNGNGTVIVTASENETFEARETTLTFSSETKTVTVEIAQRAKEFYLELDKTTLLFEAEGGTQNISVSSNENWTISNDASWITVSPQSGNGNATVIVTAVVSMRSETRTARLIFSVGTKSVITDITQEESINPQGVVINDVRWATHNVDAPGTFTENIECDGEYYQWNRGTTDFLYWDDYWNSVYANSDFWLSENNPCPSGWRVPTNDELEKLLNSDNSWTTINGINGRQFGTAPNTIFLPAGGRRVGSNLILSFRLNGFYWSDMANTSGDGTNARYLFVNNSDAGRANHLRPSGFSIRCVAE